MNYADSGHTGDSPKVTGNVAGADRTDKAREQVSASKPLNLHCSSTASGDEGNKTSHVVNVVI